MPSSIPILSRGRRQIRATVARQKVHELASQQTEIDKRRKKLIERLRKWRKTQFELMPLLGDKVESQKRCATEDQVLYLPSDLDAATRRQLAVFDFGVEEGKLREGEAFDALYSTRHWCKAIVAMMDQHIKQDNGVAARTRAALMLQDSERVRDAHMATYNHARRAMIQLGVLNEGDSGFPHLALADTRMKSRQRKRAPGDSRRTDGVVFAIRTGGPAVMTDSGMEGFGEISIDI